MAWDLIGQGAEAKIWKGTLFGRQCIMKERIPKKYRHPELESSLSKKRLNQEARCILRARKNGVNTPCVYHIDHESKKMYMSFIEGVTLKGWLLSLPAEESLNTTLDQLGRSLAKLHDADVIHGDLTSSNIILVGEQHAPCFIDFGLSFVANLPEDKAVDLYVMERALESTHTQAGLMERILNGYRKGSKKCLDAVARLADVRARGRKRVMVG